MAFAFVLVPDTTDTQNMRMYDVTALPADAGPAVQAHGLPFTPEYVLVASASQGAVEDPPWFAWDATNVTISKQGIGVNPFVCRIVVGRSV